MIVCRKQHVLLLLASVVQSRANHFELEFLDRSSKVPQGSVQNKRVIFKVDVGRINQVSAWLPSLCNGSVIMIILDPALRLVRGPGPCA